MFRNFSFSLLLTVTLLTVLYIPSKAQEKVMFDEEVTWGWPISTVYGGNSFYWWHYTSKGVTNLGNMPTDDWTTPANYQNGTIYVRFEVIDQPTTTPFQIQMGIWQDGGAKESVSLDYAKVPGGDGSVLETSLGIPNNWYKVYPTLDFTRPEDFDRIGLVLWTNTASNARGCIPMAQGWSNSSACSDASTQKDNFFPMTAHITVVACASGTTFSGWDNYTGGSTRQPTPAYTIDYTNEQTGQVVPSTDEYAYSSDMSGAVSGTGSKINLTPGTNVYFRTKASGELLESLVQTLTVKARPAAPTFTYDPVNQRTSVTVSSSYEYSENADMSSAVTGSGAYVSFAVGETRYFRQKATSSDFKSAIQALTGVAKAPTPAYTIDYINEQTNQTVPSTDEYSYNNSTWTSGTGIALVLTPGTNVYFRTKASGEILASDVQILTVKARQATPTFTYDATNQRTSQTVSSAYEYSSYSNMSSAVTGTGTYVSFATGTTRYFRKLATSTDFKSNIQTLTGGESAPSSNIGPEFVIINDIIEYPNNTDDNGFYFFYYNETMPANWLSSYDYYNGQIYTRYEILTQASSEPIALQFGVWQKLPVETGTLYENMEAQRTLNGPGSVVTSNSKLSTFWTYNGGCDFSQMDKVWHFGINPYKVTGTSSFTQIRSENTEVWNTRFTYWFPMTVRVTVVAVANGYTFSGWENYVGDGTYPAFEIDYPLEQTTDNVEATHEYSTDQENWNEGTGSKVTLLPGQDAYFRKKTAPTYVQHLEVSARPAAPAFTIDYPNEKTNQTAGTDIEYTTNSNFTSPAQGIGQYVTVTPSSTVYFRYKATSTAFSSAIQTLAIPARPAGPEYAVNYAEEQTLESIPATVEYALSADLSDKASGNGTSLSLTPGTTVYFRQLATTSKFRSNISSLSVPSRPAAPSFAVNYSTERLTTVVSTDYEYADNAGMSGAISGSNTAFLLTPGTDVYFRKKATTSAFASGIQHLEVPDRPSAPAITIDFAAEKTSEPVTSDIYYSETSGFTSTHEGTGSQISLTPGKDMYFVYKATNSAFKSTVQTLEVPTRPVISTTAVSPVMQTPVSVDIQFPGTVTDFDNSDLQVTNGTVASITGNYVAGIIPDANGTVTVKVLPNAVSPANFASELLTFTYQGATGINTTEALPFRLYPTLASSVITVEGSGITGMPYRIITVNGIEVAAGVFADTQEDLSVTGFLPGGYYLIIDLNGKPTYAKFVKVKQ